MNILVGVISVLFNISPVFTYFISENSQKTGYVSVSNARGFARPGLWAMQRKHFAGSNRHSFDNIVDSHFKVMKTVSYPLLSIRDGAKREDYDNLPRMNTEPPGPAPVRYRNTNTVSSYVIPSDKRDLKSQLDPKFNQDREIESSHSKEQQRINTPQSLLNPDFLRNVLSSNYPGKYHGRETKSNFVKVNVHKIPVSTDPQKVKRITINNNHRNNNLYNVASQPIYQPDLKMLYQNNSSAVEKNVQETSDERTAEMIQDLSAATRQHATSKTNKIEYRKRDTYYDNNFDTGKDKRNMMSETMRKYIVNKDKKINVERDGNKEYSRIGSHEDAIQSRDNPYAIFYRMHPESLDLDKQELYVPPELLEEHSSIYHTNKNKRLSESFSKGVIDFRSSSPYKDIAKKVKIHKKVKNYRSTLN